MTALAGELERVRIAGPRGAIHGELAYAPESPPRLAALLAPPHPHMGGSMENNLVRHLAAALADAAVAAVTLRFDYAAPCTDPAESMAQFWRTGHAPEDPLMVAEVAAAAAWLRGAAARLPLALIGYSFGAHAAFTVAAELHPAALILIAPTIGRHDFGRAGPHGVPTLVVFSDNDFATPLELTLRWARSPLRSAVATRCLPGADHFFLGREGEVAAACASFLHAALARGEVAT